MDRDWLIRTKSNHIFGPVSKQKLIELAKNDTLKERDELCRGNGFWFFYGEQDYFEKYVELGEEMSFNPVSEAVNIDVKSFLENFALDGNKESAQFPSENDLEYPTQPNSQVDTTIIISIPETDDRKNEGSGPVLPTQEDLEYPDED